MTNPSPAALLETAWQHITRGTVDRHHPARHPTLATSTPDGPDLRTLVLRAASHADSTLEFHTDATSPKVHQIAENPNVAIHIWVPKSSLQIRARATAHLLPGDPNLFAQLPQAARENYQGPAPGTPLPAEPNTSTDRFTRIICHLTDVDVLLLTAPHHRAIFTSKANWQGQWVAP